MNKIRTLTTILLFTISFSALAAAKIKVVVTPTKQGWLYEKGEPIFYKVEVLQEGSPLRQNLKVHFQIKPEKMAVIKEGDIKLKKGVAIIQGVKGTKPGFLRCFASVQVDGQKVDSWGTAGVAVAELRATETFPDDFSAFWAHQLKELAKVPIDPQMQKLTAQCTKDYNVYSVSFQNIRQKYGRAYSRIYGTLTVPAKAGKYPAILNCPGAGVKKQGKDSRAKQGVIILKIGIHGIPQTAPDSLFVALRDAGLSNYRMEGLDTPEEYYYKRVYLGCVRAIDFIYTLPQFDGQHVGVMGGSQGGGLSIVTAALDPRVNAQLVYFPALTDWTGYLHGRAGGWPHYFANYNVEEHPQWLKTAQYFDVINFAKILKHPGWYSWGYNDNVVPPTTAYATYNSITAPKALFIDQPQRHKWSTEQRTKGFSWLCQQLKVTN